MERLMETSNAATWHHRGRFPDVIGVHVGMETDDHGGKKIVSLTLCLPFNPLSEVYVKLFTGAIAFFFHMKITLTCF